MQLTNQLTNACIVEHCLRVKTTQITVSTRTFGLPVGYLFYLWAFCPQSWWECVLWFFTLVDEKISESQKYVKNILVTRGRVLKSLFYEEQPIYW